MEKVKCECGHINPHGTILCEACGKILDEKMNQNELLDMRYEGSARRSQTYNKTIIDKVWNFFSSVKVGVTLIVVTLIASIIGTVLPQEGNLSIQIPVNQYYEERYGWFGKIYYTLGFHDLYGSWWYLLLIASIGVSLVICSLDRVIPLYKALKNQKVTRNSGFLKRQRLYSEKQIDNTVGDIAIVKERLTKKRYNVMEENGNLLAEKGRFSRWGPYINHIGLIIFLIGAMLRFAPGFYVNEALWIKEGDTLAIPGTNKEYYLTNHQFILELYDESDGEVYKEALNQKGGVVKNYQSNITLYKAEESLPGEKPKLHKLEDYQIQVNKPLKFDQYAIYQSSYRLNEIAKMTFSLTDKESGQTFGDITIDLTNPEENYDLGNGYHVELMSYFPDFQIVDGEPSTKSSKPVNPAFAFKMVTPDKPQGEVSFAAIQQTIEPMGENKYKMTFKSVDTVNYSGLTVRKDLTLPIIALGGVIFLIGVAQGSFWYHRRIWLKQENGVILLAGHTNKNWYGFAKEIETIVHGTKIPVPVDQTLLKEKKAMEGQGGKSVG
ncbi:MULTISPECIES: cytochrome c biogenesis protein ResB [Bacillaceae]|jgi:cytochrome c biogenesis protein|uniref:cytochrome c biogenesis protein ResB n=1 Tax=Bacillaceae TaxID=186817 RepID=UPI001C117503|nr:MULTISPECIES: cytochrome c biogenesis protein ResB [Bacillaceae]MCB5933762.1 cytochrome c biogenesis protein ResB [Bacillus sp. DFI.2.34]MBU5341391.1 cytochrome c biogenesis protein ResB [Caldifermentibacillus hisashii]MCB7075516.1 cytochrome c biogenesis protein ResB [Caldibacillus thermoamylovorans]MCM3797266.1 cytochrome c biogenesis protein ResB [Caldibacillus thermoamylovorans]MEC5270470.1 cytochrome c biogenesis protein ResB [Caldifermentibacillus hisashii]